MEKEMKLMELAALVNNMKVGEVIDFAPGTMEDVEVFGGWCGVKRISEFSMDNPMYLVSHWGGEAETVLYHINEYDHRIGDFCAKELDKWWERTEQNWVNCCAKMLADYLENWCDGYVPETITVETLQMILDDEVF